MGEQVKEGLAHSSWVTQLACVEQDAIAGPCYFGTQAREVS